MGEFTDKVKGVANDAAGKVEEGLGKVFGNDYTEGKGDAEQLRGDGERFEGDVEGDIRADERAERRADERAIDGQ